MKKVIDYYNNGQDIYSIDLCHRKKGIIEFQVSKKDNEGYVDFIGFYEWLFNPKYKVFEVFGIQLNDDIFMITEKSSKAHEFLVYKSPVEIIKYLEGQISG